MTKIQDDINACVTDEAFSDVTFTVNDIITAVGNLNSQKYDGYKGTYSDHFVYASHKYLVVLSMLMNGMLVHGYNADDLLKCTLVSIPKDVRGSLSDSDNYRGIALCSAICKIVHYAIIYKYGSELHTSSLQFAYKQDHSTIMCTSIFQEVVNYYNHNGSNVYACLVDVSKAFDRINYSKLFQTVLKRKLPGTIIRLLFDSYTRQQSFVKWGQEFSDVIYMQNGVKQGVVLSATLFCIYMDELISRLVHSGIGCYIGNEYYGNISYADDLKLLCPSINGLQKMLDICDVFSKEYFVKYNASKTVAICYGKSDGKPKRSLRLDGECICWETSVKYLGNIHCSSMTNCDDIKYKKRIYINSVNKLNCQFSFASSSIRAKLLQTYCSAWYGSQNWQLDTEAVCGFHTEWNKAIRRAQGVNYSLI